jgi:glucose-fructose oxidoreductase
MIAAAQQNDIRLMIAYRLHFEEANLNAVEVAKSGRIGEVRLFQSMFTMQVKEANSRLDGEMCGGTLYDIGIYCINAARYVFQDEPTEVFAFTARHPDDPRFSEIDEMTSAIMRFPDDRLASFSCSFGASNVSSFRLVGTKGELHVDPAFSYAEKLGQSLTLNGRSHTKTFGKRDQFAPELLHFSDCVQRGEKPVPSGEEGLADVRIIRVLYEAARSGVARTLSLTPPESRPHAEMETKRPPVREPKLVHAESPTD